MRTLEFVPPTEDAFVNAISMEVVRGSKRIRIEPDTPLAQRVAALVKARLPGTQVETGDAPATDPAPVAVICETDSEKLSVALMAYLDRPNITIIAPATDRFWDRRSLFLITIPKSGTHMLTELVQAFGFGHGGECPTHPRPGTWYNIEFTNSHTAAPDFFVDTVRRSPHGNRVHPFPRHPSLFMYRNPLDIVASEANYYHEDGSTIFAGYLDALNYEQRLVRLIDDRWLLGSIRERVGKFVAWLDFGSVIPVSYEELVGSRGGGDETIQHDLVWSLMLRLHVPGKPAEIANRVFNPKSPTFREGKIGGHERRFTPQAWEKFRALPQDFMDVYGYGVRPAAGPWLPSRVAEYRRRVPRYSKADVGAWGFAVRTNLLGHNIWRWRDRFWALPLGMTLETVPPGHEPLTAPDLSTLEFLVQTKMFLEFTAKSPAAAPAGTAQPAPGADTQPRSRPVQ